MQTSNATQARDEAKARHVVAGLASGTLILTAAGEIAVENLQPGDRIITRSGMRMLRGITSTLHERTELIQIQPGALGHSRPTQPMLAAPGQQVLLRDWRAVALYKRPQALVPVARLVDGEYVVRAGVGRIALHELHFDSVEVIYADGVEIAVAPLPATATAQV